MSLFLRLDPRFKLILGLFCICLLITSKGVFFPSLVLLLCVSVLNIRSMPLKKLIHRFSEPMVIVATLIVIKALSPKGVVLFELNIPLPLLGSITLPVYEGALREGVLLGLRVMSSVSVIVLMGEFMALYELIYALAWFRVPKEMVEILLLTNRFMFTLLEEARIIYFSQKNRMGYVSIKSSFRSLGIMSGALMIKVLEKGQKAAASMVQRGYEGEIPLTAQAPPPKKEIIFMPFFMSVLVFLWWI